MKARTRVCAAVGCAVVALATGCNSIGSNRPSSVSTYNGAAGDRVGGNVFADPQACDRLAARTDEQASRTALTNAEQTEP